MCRREQARAHSALTDHLREQALAVHAATVDLAVPSSRSDRVGVEQLDLLNHENLSLGCLSLGCLGNLSRGEEEASRERSSRARGDVHSPENSQEQNLAYRHRDL